MHKSRVASYNVRSISRSGGKWEERSFTPIDCQTITRGFSSVFYCAAYLIISWTIYYL
jgi:hypothetical protein